MSNELSFDVPGFETPVVFDENHQGVCLHNMPMNAKWLFYRLIAGNGDYAVHYISVGKDYGMLEEFGSRVPVALGDEADESSYMDIMCAKYPRLNSISHLTSTSEFPYLNVRWQSTPITHQIIVVEGLFTEWGTVTALSTDLLSQLIHLKKEYEYSDRKAFYFVLCLGDIRIPSAERQIYHLAQMQYFLEDSPKDLVSDKVHVEVVHTPRKISQIKTFEKAIPAYGRIKDIKYPMGSIEKSTDGLFLGIQHDPFELPRKKVFHLTPKGGRGVCIVPTQQSADDIGRMFHWQKIYGDICSQEFLDKHPFFKGKDDCLTPKSFADILFYLEDARKEKPRTIVLLGVQWRSWNNSDFCRDFTTFMRDVQDMKWKGWSFIFVNDPEDIMTEITSLCEARMTDVSNQLLRAMILGTAHKYWCQASIDDSFIASLYGRLMFLHLPIEDLEI